MSHRFTFSKFFTFISRERIVASASKNETKYTGNLKVNLGQNLVRTNRLLWTSNRLYPTFKTGLIARTRTVWLILNHRFYQRSPNSRAKSLKRKLWTVVRGVLLTTGGLVWLVGFGAYVALDKVTVDYLDNENKATASAVHRKLAEHFFNEENEAEIFRKEHALDTIWQKLSREERVKEIFGQPVFICGYSYKFMNSGQEFGEVKVENDVSKMNDGKTGEPVEKEITEFDSEVIDGHIWEAGCYIKGPKQTGIMNIKFEWHQEEWVPVSLHLETIERTGHVVSNVSALLPNGIKNFTRLCN